MSEGPSIEGERRVVLPPRLRGASKAWMMVPMLAG